MNIKPIETNYNGYRFRSRLEARWAVFFDALKIKYYYEFEGFDIDGTFYLPDFYLPELDCYFEVKGVMTTEDEQKILKFAASINKQVFIGTADFSVLLVYYNYIYDEWAYDSNYAFINECDQCKKVMFVDPTVWYGDCPKCNIDYVDKQFHAFAQEYDKRNDLYAKKITSAILKAKQARFEHGESP